MSVLPLLGVVACADVWGFSDLTGGSDALAPDAAMTQEGAVDGTEGGMESGPDSAQEEDEPSGDLPDAREEREVGEAGEGGMTVRDGAPVDGGNDAAACKAICTMGCCDSQGLCWPGTATAHCGTNGNACEACSGAGCTLATGCCTTKQACGCQLTPLVCN